MRTVLLIDDDVTGVRTRAALLKTVGCKTVIAVTGAEGVEAALTRDVDAVVLDYFLPDMTGGQVLQAIREVKPSMPIIILSGGMNLPDGLEAQAADVIVKGSGALRLLNALTASVSWV